MLKGCAEKTVDGVIADGRTVPETFDAMRSHISGSEGTDVTGGMLGKVRELLGIDLCIFNAIRPGMIARFLFGEEPGTRITERKSRPVCICSKCA